MLLAVFADLPYNSIIGVPGLCTADEKKQIYEESGSTPMLLPQRARRLAIFAYYDADGIVDDYVPYLLERVGQFCEKQIVMVNGFLTQEGEAKLRPFAAQIVYRANTGYDVTAYKEGVLAERERWAEYDEILFYNQTIFGPVCPLDDMFRSMAARDVDFWGLTRHKGARAASWDENTPIPPHVQSFFFAVRSSMFRSDSFAQYWEALPRIDTYWDAVGKHEIVFTNHFASLGFRWDVYVNTEDLEIYNDYPLMGMPVTLLKERGCPFFKRKNFLTRRFDYTTVPQGQAAQQLYDYIRQETAYPIALVVQNILRTVSLTLIEQSLTLYYDPSRCAPYTGRWAAVLYFSGEPLAEMLCAAAGRLAGRADCFAVFSDEALREKWADKLPEGTLITESEKKGGAVLFDTLWSRLCTYPYLLYLSSDMPKLLEQFADATSLMRAVEALADPRAVALLEQNPEIGALLPVMPSHQDTLTQSASLSYQGKALRQAAQKLGLAMPDEKAKAGVASRGGMFLARTGALEPLAKQALWPELFEGMYPLWEFLMPLAAQKAGWLTAFSVSPATAYGELACQKSMFENIQSMWVTPRRADYGNILFRMQGILDFYYERRYQMTLEQAFKADLTFRQKMWICLQILLKPATFEKLHRLLGGHSAPARPPEDTLD